MKKNLLLIVIVFSFLTNACTSEESKAKSALKVYLKSTLRDPNSLEIYSTTLEKKNKRHYIITADYGSKNGFGGMVRKTEKFTIIGNYVGPYFGK